MNQDVPEIFSFCVSIHKLYTVLTNGIKEINNFVFLSVHFDVCIIEILQWTGQEDMILAKGGCLCRPIALQWSLAR